MKPLILFTAMTVIGLFGIIGTVEYAHAEIHEYSLNEIFDNCDTSPIDIEIGDYLYFFNNGTEPMNSQDVNQFAKVVNIRGAHLISEYNDNDGNRIVEFFPNGYILLITTNDWDNYQTRQHNIPLPEKCNEVTKPLRIHLSGKLSQHQSNNQDIINLIARTFNLTPTNQPITTEPTNQGNIDKWKQRYNTCFDKKETLINKVSNLESSLEQLDIYKQNLTNANFEIDKLKQEKAQLIKKVETLETQLSEN